MEFSVPWKTRVVYALFLTYLTAMAFQIRVVKGVQDVHTACPAFWENSRMIIRGQAERNLRE
jgi:hypothetical protein